MRDPSIHITESQLIKILEKLRGDSKGLYRPGVMCKLIMEEAKKYCVVNRGLKIDNNRLEKKAERVISSNMFSAMLFSNILLMIRKQMRHRGVRPIKAGSKDWELIKEITNGATEFCKVYELDVKMGFTEYIRIGISKMAKFSLPKLVGMNQSIFDAYSALLEIKEDDNVNATQGLFNYYQKLIVTRTGIITPYEKIPEKYIYFIKARKEANKYNVSYKDYIDAQFEGLDYIGGIPDPIQLIGDKAIERLNKYMFKKKKDNIPEENKKRINWEKIFSDVDNKD